jgi:hypothetical protein
MKKYSAVVVFVLSIIIVAYQNCGEIKLNKRMMESNIPLETTTTEETVTSTTSVTSTTTDSSTTSTTNTTTPTFPVDYTGDFNTMTGPGGDQPDYSVNGVAWDRGFEKAVLLPEEQVLAMKFSLPYDLTLSWVGGLNCQSPPGTRVLISVSKYAGDLTSQCGGLMFGATSGGTLDIFTSGTGPCVFEPNQSYYINLKFPDENTTPDCSGFFPGYPNGKHLLHLKLSKY